MWSFEQDGINSLCFKDSGKEILNFINQEGEITPADLKRAEEITRALNEAASIKPNILNNCPRCNRIYQFEEERANRICAVCIQDLFDSVEPPSVKPCCCKGKHGISVRIEIVKENKAGKGKTKGGAK